MDRLDRSLRILDQDPRIERLAARLLPGAARGEAILDVVVLEAEPRQLGLFFDNHETPSVGAYAGRIALSHANALGFGDAIGLELTKTEGLTRLRGSYALPLHPNGPRLLVDGNATLAELVDGAFDDLDIETTNASLGIGLGQTVFHGVDDRVDLSLVFELRRSRTELLGRGFSFGDDGTQSGRAEVRVLRAAADWTHRDTPDGVFVSWLGQARGTYRLPRSGVELRLRGDLQLADRPLLSLEQYSVGGPGSVRGVRRNLLVRDQGFAAALDVFVPLWRSADERPIVAFVPFLDVGRAWQRDRPTSGKRTISGAGAGLAWSPHPQLEFEVEFAKAIRETDDSGDLQDDGVYLRAVGWAF
jgi:hemolysin activation/secretion protein